MNAAALERRLTAVAADYRAKGYFPSCTVAVTGREGTLCAFSLGDARPGSLFDLASVTKVCTSTLMLLAIEEGRARLDTPLTAVLTFPAADKALARRLENVTVFRLLTHTAGLIDWYPFYADGRDFATALSAALRGARVEGMVYSDLGFILLGKMLEKLYASPLDALVRDRLCAPYGLDGLQYLPDPAQDIVPSSFGNPIEEAMCRERGMAFDAFRPHTPLRGEVNDGNAHYYLHGVSGHAGLFAPAEALCGLIRLYLNTASPLLQSALREQAPTRGLGFQVNDLYPHGAGHTGFTGTALYICREKGVGCASLTNRLFYPHPNPNATHDFRRALHGALYASL